MRAQFAAATRTAAYRRVQPRPPPAAAGVNSHTHAAPLSLCTFPCTLQEINDVRAGIEKGKNDIIKSTIAIMGTFSAIAFTITRLMSV
jgi:hypothetical protein